MAEATIQGVAYTCATCRASFKSFRGGAVRCVACGSMDTAPTPEPEEAPAGPTATLTPLVGTNAGDLTSEYACPGCAARFLWNHTKKGSLSPVCPRCSNAGVVERTPRIRVLVLPKGSVHAMQTGQPLPTKKVMTAREAKRWRFITRNWKLRCELASHLDGLENLLTRLRVDGPKSREITQLIGAVLAEVDAEQVKMLEQYNSLVDAER